VEELYVWTDNVEYIASGSQDLAIIMAADRVDLGDLSRLVGHGGVLYSPVTAEDCVLRIKSRAQALGLLMYAVNGHPVVIKSPPITILMPVYNASAATLSALFSVLQTIASLPVSLLVINDGSTEEGLAANIRTIMEKHPQGTFLDRSDNWGFIRTVNQGFGKIPRHHDVVLLNSDVIVTPDWIPKLCLAAYSQPQVATATPVSNNASIYSLDLDQSLLMLCNRALEHRDGPPRHYPVIPTGVGFCLYIRHEARQMMEGFDEIYGAGYGEETDFCLRAVQAGFVNVLDDRTVIFHHGRLSMGSRADFGWSNRTSEEELERRYPWYPHTVQRFLQSGFMSALAQYWMPWQRKNRPKERPRIWMQLQAPYHGQHISGTERHVYALIEQLRVFYDVYAVWEARTQLVIKEMTAEDAWEYVQSWVPTVPEGQWQPRRTTAVERLKEELAAWKIDLVHVQHTIHSGWDVVVAAHELALPVIYTVHDYYALCPDYNLIGPKGVFCQLPSAADCEQCLASKPAIRVPSIDQWRRQSQKALETVDCVVFPSRSAEDLFRSQMSIRSDRVIEHGLSVRTVVAPPEWSRHLAIIGFAGLVKGRPLLSQLIPQLVHKGYQIHLFGSEQTHWPALAGVSHVIFHGMYSGSEALITQLSESGVAGAVFASPWPETFSLTISEAWAAGLPIVVGPLGAPMARIRQQGGGIVSDGYTAQDFLHAVNQLHHHYDALRQEVWAIQQTWRDELDMAAAYAQLYGSWIKSPEPQDL
jgi:GT2 family glycosyltransferase